MNTDLTLTKTLEEMQKCEEEKGEKDPVEGAQMYYLEASDVPLGLAVTAEE